jgi:AcrR family transcriptional regulator
MVEKNDDTAVKIRRAATEIFAAKGLAGARVSEIAESAGVNKALIFYYYRSKDNLYREVLRTEFGTIVGRLYEQALSGGSVEERVEHIIQTYIGYLAERPLIPRLVMSEIMNGLPYIRPIAQELFHSGPRGLPDVLMEMLSGAVSSGRFRPVDPGQTILSLIGMMVFPFIARPFVEIMRPELDLDDSEFWEQRKKAVPDLLFYGLLQSGEGESS